MLAKCRFHSTQLAIAEDILFPHDSSPTLLFPDIPTVFFPAKATRPASVTFAIITPSASPSSTWTIYTLQMILLDAFHSSNCKKCFESGSVLFSPKTNSPTKCLSQGRIFDSELLVDVPKHGPLGRLRPRPSSSPPHLRRRRITLQKVRKRMRNKAPSSSR